MFNTNNQKLQSTDISVLDSNAKVTKILLAVPAIDMKNNNSAMATVSISAKKYPSVFVTFNYLYTAVFPSLLAINPSSASNTGGQTILVTIKFFQYPASNVILNFANYILPAIILPQSNVRFTVLSFNVPNSNIGVGKYTASIYPSGLGCEIFCSQSVSFEYSVEDFVKLKFLVPPISIVSNQVLKYSKTFPAVGLTGLNPADDCSDVHGTIELQNATTVIATCNSLSWPDNKTASLILNAPSDLYNLNNINVTITIYANNYVLKYWLWIFDARYPRIVSINPSTIPVVSQIGKNILTFEPNATMLVKNFPLNKNINSLNVTLYSREGSFDLQILAFSYVTTGCSDLMVLLMDCNTTSIKIRIPSQSLTGPKTITIKSGSGLTLQTSIEYREICDYQKFCGNALVDYRQILLTAMLDCNPDFCIDPGSIPDPVFLSSFPTRGSIASGTVVEINLINFPSFKTYDTIISIGSSLVPIISLVASGTILQNQVQIRFSISSLSSDLVGDQVFKVSSIVGSSERAVMIPFRFMPLVNGPPTVVEYSPISTVLDSEITTTILLQNVQELDVVNGMYNLSSIQIQITDPMGNARTGVSVVPRYSNTDGTLLVISNISADIEGFWNISFSSISTYLQAYKTVISLEVIELAPYVGGVYPDVVPVNSETYVEVRIWYLPPRTAGILVKATMESLSANSTILDDVFLKETSARSCLSAACSVYILRVLIPAAAKAVWIQESTARVFLDIHWYDASLSSSKKFNLSYSFRYLPVSAKQTPWFPPSSIIGSTTTMSSRIENILCPNLIIRFGFPLNNIQSNWTCKVLSLISVSVQLQLPNFPYAARIPVHVSDASDSLSDVISYFDFAPPPIMFVPIDGNAVGGYVITAVVYGWACVSKDSIYATFYDNDNHFVWNTTVEEILDATFTNITSVFSVKIRAPNYPYITSSSGPRERKVAVIIQSADNKYSAAGSFTYFMLPSITGINPARASIYGSSNSPDKGSISVEIRGMPQSVSPDRIQTTFSGNFGNFLCDGTLCEVTKVVNGADKSVLTVKLPRTKLTAGPCTLSVEYVADNLHQNRSATSNFEFFTPVPVIRSVKWCEQCAPCTSSVCPVCLQHGVCVSKGKSKAPLETMAFPDASACDDGCHGVLQVSVENVPSVVFNVSSGIAVPSSQIVCSFGDVYSVGSLRRIVSQNEGVLVFEVEPPPISSSGQVLASLFIYPLGSLIPSTVSFKVLFIDNTVQLNCGGSGCEASFSGQSAFLLNITNLEVVDGVPLEMQINLNFGMHPAATIEKFSGSPLVLKVTPPPLENSESYDSYYRLPMTLIHPQDSRIVASTIFTYWVTPRVVSAEFSSRGDSVDIMFTASTNNGGASQGAGDCSVMLLDTSLLGANPSCSWVTSDHLVIFLGSNARLSVGDSLQLFNIRSQNEVTEPTTAKFNVQAPYLRLAPILWLKGPTTIDLCSALTLQAFSSSVRPLSYAWSCSNDEVLNMKISQITNDLIQFRAGTPELSTMDKTYEVSVSGTDFLGTTSETVTIYITKRGLPVPQITYTPQKIDIFRNQPVSVIFHTVFSACPTTSASIDFTWRQLSGPSIIPSEFLYPIAELRLPANVLYPASTYSLALTAAMSNDLSQTSEIVYTINVGAQQLMARISGGNKDISVEQDIVLDASGSRDPDTPLVGSQGLSFVWKCSTYDRDGLEYPCLTSTSKLLEMEQASGIRVSAGDLWALGDNNPYWFSVTVKKAGKLPVMATAYVNIFEASIPAVDVRVPSQYSENIRTDGSISLGPSTRLILLGSCSSSIENVEYLWSLEATVQILEAVQNQYLDVVPLGFSAQNFVLDFTAAGIHLNSDYTVSLACINSAGSSMASFQVNTNSPPSGGSCRACLDGTSAFTCVKSGYALIDIFGISCSGWGDENLPLKYSFGYLDADTDESKPTWFPYSFESSVNLIFSTGNFVCKAVVMDSLGSVTVEITDTAEISLTTGYRRLLMPVVTMTSILESALIQLQGALQTKDLSVVNMLVAAISREVDRASMEGQQNQSFKWREDLVAALEQASQFSVLDQDFVCGMMDRAALITLSANLTSESIIDSILMARKLIDAAALTQITKTCANSAFSFYSSVLQAYTRFETKDQNLTRLILNNLEPFVLTSANKLALEMLPGEKVLLQSSFSRVEVHRVKLGSLPSRSLCSIGNLVCTSYNLDFSLPPAFNQDIDLSEDDVVDLVIHGYSNAPKADKDDDIISTAHLAGLSMQHPNGSKIHVTDSRESINITFIVPALDLKEKRVCVFWDPEISSYSGNNLGTAHHPGSDICQTTHLTLFSLAKGAFNSISGVPKSTITAISPSYGALYSSPGLEGLGLTLLVPKQCFLPSPATKLFWSIDSSLGVVKAWLPDSFWLTNTNSSELICVTVVKLPLNISMPAGSTGYCPVAIDLTPHYLVLDTPLSISLPCDEYSSSSSVKEGFDFDLIQKIWVLEDVAANRSQDSGVAWLSISKLSLHAAFLFSSNASSKLMEATTQPSNVPAAVASAVGGVVLLSCLIAGLFMMRRKQHQHQQQINSCENSPKDETLEVQVKHETLEVQVKQDSDMEQENIQDNETKADIYESVSVISVQSKTWAEYAFADLAILNPILDTGTLTGIHEPEKNSSEGSSHSNTGSTSKNPFNGGVSLDSNSDSPDLKMTNSDPSKYIQATQFNMPVLSSSMVAEAESIKESQSTPAVLFKHHDFIQQPTITASLALVSIQADGQETIPDGYAGSNTKAWA